MNQKKKKRENEGYDNISSAQFRISHGESSVQTVRDKLLRNVSAEISQNDNVNVNDLYLRVML